MSEKPPLKTFVFHWKDGRQVESKGYDVSHAFSNAGYGGGAIRVLDYWEEKKERDENEASSD